jgi:hypothetical protein
MTQPTWVRTIPWIIVSTLLAANLATQLLLLRRPAASMRDAVELSRLIKLQTMSDEERESARRLLERIPAVYLTTGSSVQVSGGQIYVEGGILDLFGSTSPNEPLPVRIIR